MDEGVAGMKLAETPAAHPPDLAYGAEGTPAAHPTQCNLIFDVQLLGVQ